MTKRPGRHSRRPVPSPCLVLISFLDDAGDNTHLARFVPSSSSRFLFTLFPFRIALALLFSSPLPYFLPFFPRTHLARSVSGSCSTAGRHMNYLSSGKRHRGRNKSDPAVVFFHAPCLTVASVSAATHHHVAALLSMLSLTRVEEFTPTPTLSPL
jgi:hypothetical protein